MKAYSIFIVGMYGIPSHIIRFVRNLKQTKIYHLWEFCINDEYPHPHIH